MVARQQRIMPASSVVLTGELSLSIQNNSVMIKERGRSSGFEVDTLLRYPLSSSDEHKATERHPGQRRNSQFRNPRGQNYWRMENTGNMAIVKAFFGKK
jgi:hypothetical protein